ncbi:MAG: GIY-YIG nuclease family protein [Treponema sp.]|nr:GIY-YIG nuclease family protein [Treponema sp.]
MEMEIKVELTDGEYGPKCILITGSSMHGFHCTKTQLKWLLKDTKYEHFDFHKPGVYLLKSDYIEDGKDYTKEKVYIGQSDNIADRLNHHLLNKNMDFDEVIIFIGGDIKKTEICYIESRVIQMAKAAKNAKIIILDNKNEQKLPENLTNQEIKIMENEYLDKIKLILPIAGFNCLKSAIIKTPKNQLNLFPNAKYHLTIKSKLIAYLEERPQGLVVLKNSYAKTKEGDALGHCYRELRKKYLDDGILKKCEDINFYRFTEDTIFNSTSAAASVILGVMTSGPKTWKKCK